MADETPSVARLEMDRGLPIGNSEDVFGRRAAHMKIGNKPTEPIPTYNVSPNPTEIQVTYFNAASAVATAVETTVVSLTVTTTYFSMTRVEVSGTNIADYMVKVDGVVIARKQTWFGGGLITGFEFSDPSGEGLRYLLGQVIEVTVIHSRPDVGTFYGRIQGAIPT